MPALEKKRASVLAAKRAQKNHAAAAAGKFAGKIDRDIELKGKCILVSTHKAAFRTAFEFFEKHKDDKPSADLYFTMANEMETLLDKASGDVLTANLLAAVYNTVTKNGSA